MNSIPRATVTTSLQKFWAGLGKTIRVYLSDEPQGKVLFEAEVHKYVCFEVSIFGFGVKFCVYLK